MENLQDVQLCKKKREERKQFKGRVKMRSDGSEYQSENFKITPSDKY
jgi:hypothetical protein